MITGVVPACGASRRMGSPKALLLDGEGRTFLERIVGTLRAGGCSSVVVTLPSREGPLAAVTEKSGASSLYIDEPGEGPISSLRLALRTFSTEVLACLYFPVDHPLVTVQTVAELIRRHEETDAPIVLPTHGGRRGHPVLFGRSVFPQLLSANLVEGARQVVRSHAATLQEVEVDDPGIHANLDTLHAYRKYFPVAYRKRFHSR